MDHFSVDCRFSDLNRSSSELKTPASKKIIHLQSLAVESFDGIVVINYQSALNLSNQRSVLERDEILLYFQSEKSFVKDVQQDAATTTLRRTISTNSFRRMQNDTGVITENKKS